MTNHQPQVAIIILNWNGLRDTLECLRSVFKNTYKNYSIYIIDNASKKDELAKIKDFCKKHLSTSASGGNHRSPTFFIQNQSNLGFSEGNNVGIRQALKKNTDYIFTLNNDTVVDKNFLQATINCTQTNKAGIVATTMVNYYHRSKLDNTGHELLSTGDTIPRDRNSKFKTDSKFEIRNSKFPMGACAGAALYSSEMLKKIGLFDADFFLNYEDSDLSLRAIVQGYTCVHCPNSIIYHKLNASISKIKDPVYRIRSQRNQLWAYLHNTPLLVILLNLPWIILRDLLVVLISIITFRWTITYIFIISRLQILVSLPKILKKRRKVMKKRKMSSLEYWSKQKSWFTTYWNYFKEIVIKRKNSVMN